MLVLLGEVAMSESCLVMSAITVSGELDVNMPCY